ncbi:T9SS type A sorting domain-containing protein [Chryseobacterium tructae]|nr:T9SS type A sorting domain-containing protein [Chryseobacterium tructae]MDN3690835.1 T9SS type A sorting domain-containing protein [Chryseobacterium tructae]
MGGYRGSDGGFTFVGKRGYFWSSTPTGIGGKYLYIGGVVNAAAGAPRGQGASVRCIKADFELGVSDAYLKKHTVDVYPNPVKGVLSVKSESEIKEIKIINTIGQSVVASLSNNNIDMNRLPKGIYMIELKLKNGESVVKKIMKD